MWPNFAASPELYKKKVLKKNTATRNNTGNTNTTEQKYPENKNGKEINCMDIYIRIF